MVPLIQAPRHCTQPIFLPLTQALHHFARSLSPHLFITVPNPFSSPSPRLFITVSYLSLPSPRLFITVPDPCITLPINQGLHPRSSSLCPIPFLLLRLGSATALALIIPRARQHCQAICAAGAAGSIKPAGRWSRHYGALGAGQPLLLFTASRLAAPAPSCSFSCQQNSCPCPPPCSFLLPAE